MPVSKENQKLYPGGSLHSKEWMSLRSERLKDQDNKCKFCGVTNRTYGVRDITGKFWSYEQFENGGIPDKIVFEKNGAQIKMAIRIVLTIAHLDHNPQNNSPENTPALCQRCHLRHDSKHHAINSRKTREYKKGPVLF